MSSVNNVSSRFNAAASAAAAAAGAVATTAAATVGNVVSAAVDGIDAAVRTAAPLVAAAPVRVEVGQDPSSFNDDRIFLGKDGALQGDSGLTNVWTRGWAAIREGVLKLRHGSQAPGSPFLSAEVEAALRNQAPAEALDKMAQAFGVRRADFAEVAQLAHRPQAQHWEGKCHAWAWAAMSKILNARIETEGPPGERGLWCGGQWLSRADLGNWMMGVADTISVNDSNRLFDTRISAADLIKGVVIFLANEGGGFVADVYNDAREGQRQVWNQPYKSTKVTTQTLAAEPTAAVLAVAAADGIAGGVAVKQVKIDAIYGSETADDTEGAPGESSSHWNTYAVVDADGLVLTAYMAYDEKLANVSGLPSKSSSNAPEYIWRPTLDAIDDVLAGRPNATVDNNAYGREFRFFVNTVLMKGITSPTRKAFETEVVQAIGPIPDGSGIPAARVRQLAQQYPGIANAYSPAQWAESFGAQGLKARDFGAAWPTTAVA